MVFRSFFPAATRKWIFQFSLKRRRYGAGRPENQKLKQRRYIFPYGNSPSLSFFFFCKSLFRLGCVVDFWRSRARAHGYSLNGLLFSFLNEGRWKSNFLSRHERNFTLTHSEEHSRIFVPFQRQGDGDSARIFPYFFFLGRVANTEHGNFTLLFIAFWWFVLSMA